MNTAELEKLFLADPGTIEGRYQIIASAIHDQGCEAHAWIIARDLESGKLVEVEGEHCSCGGFDGQWEPVETTIAAILLTCSNAIKYGTYLDQITMAEDLQKQIAAGVLRE